METKEEEIALNLTILCRFSRIAYEKLIVEI